MIDFLKINKLYYKMSHDLIDDLKDFPYVIVKGVPLSILSYNDPGVRFTSDIDILTDVKNLKELDEYLQKNGFHQYIDECDNKRNMRVFCLTSSHQLVQYEKHLGRIKTAVDVNFDLFLGKYTGVRIDISDFISDFIYMNVFGIKVKTLLPEKAYHPSCAFYG